MAPNASGVFRQAGMEEKPERYDPARKTVEDHGASVASYSWGHNPYENDYVETTPGMYSVYAWEMDKLVWELDLFTAQAMANKGPQNMHPEAAAKNVLSVGGMIHENDANLSNDSADDGSCHNPNVNPGSCPSTGPTDDGRIKPDLVGPYEAVFATSTVEGTDTAENFWGTSASTPFVAGLGALAQEMYREGVFVNETGPDTSGLPSASLTKALLVASGKDYAWEQVEIPGRYHRDNPERPRNSHYLRDVQGWGLPSVWNLYDDAGGLVTVNETVNLSTSNTFAMEYNLNDNTVALNVSLVWTEPPTGACT